MVLMQELKAQSRIELGKKTNALRRAGFMPAVLYGDGVLSQAIKVSSRNFEKVLKEAGESTLVSLKVDETLYNVLIHDISRDPLRGTPVHADFYAVRMDKEIRVKVPLEFLGESPAVKNDGGILVKVLQELEVEALPKDLPHVLQVDLSGLVVLESKFKVGDIRLPDGVRIIADPEDVILLVEPPRTAEELGELELAPVAELKEVKTEQELKRDEEQKKEKEEKEVG